MRVMKSEHITALVFENMDDVTSMIAEITKLKSDVESGAVVLPSAFTIVEEGMTDEEQTAFSAQVAGKQQ